MMIPVIAFCAVVFFCSLVGIFAVVIRADKDNHVADNTANGNANAKVELRELYESFEKKKFDKDYGVFVGLNPRNKSALFGYKIVVIDAEYFSKDDIDILHKNGIKVLSYLNMGSVEKFRDYYGEFEDITLGEYKNWEDEYWIDTSSENWKKHIKQLSEDLTKKGVDGFFVDNCDVYYYHAEQKIYDGLIDMLKELNEIGKYIVINGGDYFVRMYLQDEFQKNKLFDAVNQESLFTAINFEDSSFVRQEIETTEYYKEYLESCKANDVQVFVTEYTKDKHLENLSEKYCYEKDYRLYVSKSLNLDS